MVRKDRTRCHRAWRLYLSCGPEAKAHAIHPPVQRATQAREVEVLRHSAPNYSRINRYSPLVSMMALIGLCESHLALAQKKYKIEETPAGNSRYLQEH